jgi:hypothetical protein
MPLIPRDKCEILLAVDVAILCHRRSIHTNLSGTEVMYRTPGEMTSSQNKQVQDGCHVYGHRLEACCRSSDEHTCKDGLRHKRLLINYVRSI